MATVNLTPWIYSTANVLLTVLCVRSFHRVTVCDIITHKNQCKIHFHMARPALWYSHTRSIVTIFVYGRSGFDSKILMIVNCEFFRSSQSKESQSTTQAYSITVRDR